MMELAWRAASVLTRPYAIFGLPTGFSFALQAGSPPHGDEDKSDIVVPLAISLVLTTVSLVIGGLVWWSRRRRRRLRGTGGSEDGKDWPTSQTDPDGAVRM